MSKLAELVLEMAEAIDAEHADIGTGPRTSLVVMREAVQEAQRVQATEEGIRVQERMAARIRAQLEAEARLNNPHAYE